MLTYPNIDPIALALGPIEIRWYSLAYIFGILLALLYMHLLDKKYRFKLTSPKLLEDLSFYIILGIILGGRLGYVLFYNPGYYLQNIIEIFFIWQGGMSFHGVLTGVSIAVLLFCRKNNLSYLRYMDLISAASPIGIFLGRIANFINGELFGRPTNLPWGMIFPHGDHQPRHPSQIYEAIFEGLFAFIILFLCFKLKNIRDNPGKITGIFISIYAIARILIEFTREPDPQLGLFLNFISMGQILSLILLALGIYLSLIFPRGFPKK